MRMHIQLTWSYLLQLTWSYLLLWIFRGACKLADKICLEISPERALDPSVQDTEF